MKVRELRRLLFEEPQDAEVEVNIKTVLYPIEGVTTSYGDAEHGSTNGFAHVCINTGEGREDVE